MSHKPTHRSISIRESGGVLIPLMVVMLVVTIAIVAYFKYQSIKEIGRLEADLCAAKAHANMVLYNEGLETKGDVIEQADKSADEIQKMIIKINSSKFSDEPLAESAVAILSSIRDYLNAQSRFGVTHIETQVFIGTMGSAGANDVYRVRQEAEEIERRLTDAGDRRIASLYAVANATKRRGIQFDEACLVDAIAFERAARTLEELRKTELAKAGLPFE